MTVLIDDRARGAIAGESARRRVRETGGALFGFVNGDVLIIVCAYGPGPRARHRRFSFEPRRDATEAIMHAVRATSCQRYRFLGSWHTHPNGVAVPSSRDIATAREIAEDRAVRLPNPLVLIQATRPAGRGALPTDLRAWRWSRAARTLVPDAVESIKLDVRWCPPVELAAGRRSVEVSG